ncbi:hypothetical protein BMR07_13600 [Methylococcaceae bacterium CS1]|nr:hypothetical protein BMR10_09990 [Methylococcaceae bacterium CS4]TXL04018.1 hypothetical protein BMR07_13600 [Methylococcaceae bacterium CS1]TXL04192.1 hypothetical protein BMR09_13205 [Methylococcaceae bacterium CS3]
MKDTRSRIKIYLMLFAFLNSMNVTAGGFGSADGGTGFGKWDTQEVEEEEEEERPKDVYPEMSLQMAKSFTLYDDVDDGQTLVTYSFYPEVTGWHVFQTYGNTDTVMEIYHNGHSIVPEGESDGDRGDGNNELHHQWLEAKERITVQVYLHHHMSRASVILNVRTEDPLEELYKPSKLGYAKKFWLDPGRSYFTTRFTPKESGWYNIETFSDDEDTVMEIYNPQGHSMVAAGESDGDRGVDNEELQRKYFDAGKTYTIQVYMEDSDDEGFAWVHVWRSSWNPL